jgi:hypothetical protein
MEIDDYQVHSVLITIKYSKEHFDDNDHHGNFNKSAGDKDGMGTVGFTDLSNWQFKP